MPKKKITKSPTPSRAREAAQKRETPSSISAHSLVFEAVNAAANGMSLYRIAASDELGIQDALVELLLDRARVGDFFEPEEGVTYEVTVKREKA